MDRFHIEGFDSLPFQPNDHEQLAVDESSQLFFPYPSTEGAFSPQLYRLATPSTNPDYENQRRIGNSSTPCLASAQHHRPSRDLHESSRQTPPPQWLVPPQPLTGATSGHSYIVPDQPAKPLPKRGRAEYHPDANVSNISPTRFEGPATPRLPAASKSSSSTIPATRQRHITPPSACLSSTKSKSSPVRPQKRQRRPIAPEPPSLIALSPRRDASILPRTADFPQPDPQADNIIRQIVLGSHQNPITKTKVDVFPYFLSHEFFAAHPWVYMDRTQFAYPDGEGCGGPPAIDYPMHIQPRTVDRDIRCYFCRSREAYSCYLHWTRHVREQHNIIVKLRDKTSTKYLNRVGKNDYGPPDRGCIIIKFVHASQAPSFPTGIPTPVSTLLPSTSRGAVLPPQSSSLHAAQQIPAQPLLLPLDAVPSPTLPTPAPSSSAVIASSTKPTDVPAIAGCDMFSHPRHQPSNIAIGDPFGLAPAATSMSLQGSQASFATGSSGEDDVDEIARYLLEAMKNEGLHFGDFMSPMVAESTMPDDAISSQSSDISSPWIDTPVLHSGVDLFSNLDSLFDGTETPHLFTSTPQTRVEYHHSVTEHALQAGTRTDHGSAGTFSPSPPRGVKRKADDPTSDWWEGFDSGEDWESVLSQLRYSECL